MYHYKKRATKAKSSIAQKGRIYKVSPERRYFLPTVKKPVCFISYAWEENETDAGKKANAIWHAKLSRLKEDLEKIGARVFLDIYNMHGNMPKQMQDEIDKSDIIFLIGTPRLMTRLQNSSTNAAFEWEHIKTKLQQSPHCLLPLWFEGDFVTSIPGDARQTLVRDMREEDSFEKIMAALSNPMGIIPNIFGLHSLDRMHPIMQQYRTCWEALETKFKNIDLELSNETLLINQPLPGSVMPVSNNLNHPINSNSAVSSNTHTGSGVYSLWTNCLVVNGHQNLGLKKFTNNAINIRFN